MILRGDVDEVREAAIDEILERRNRKGTPDDSGLPMPKELTAWVWWDKQRHADLPLWQHCLYAAAQAGCRDISGTATKLYVRLGGVLKSSLSRRDKARLKKETANSDLSDMIAAMNLHTFKLISEEASKKSAKKPKADRRSNG
jgi:hypothetical protein